MRERNAIIEDVRRIRHQQSARFGHDTDKYLDHLKRLETSKPPGRKPSRKQSAKDPLPVTV